ncbi:MULTISPECIES: hypothetical protein [Thiorhodovibrio]|uniref:hypothetical protein n=1 Tax=Thiorhodovibrio TaxID=61593 RepID=UPI001914C4BE|nr:MULTISPECIES: hypothetical protein [Thiorhodovibrio]WPL13355.1 hypothetical protein Thiosp_03156 [Thiorhodovibrio litoralis]
MNPSTFSLTAALLWFGLGTLTIALLGATLTRLADRLADHTGLGEAVFGSGAAGRDDLSAGQCRLAHGGPGRTSGTGRQ